MQTNFRKLHLINMNNLKYEQELYHKGHNLVCGVDEAGRGPLVGPVVAAAIILAKGYKNVELKDSKLLTEKKRQTLNKILKKDAVSYSYGIIDANEIDEINILNATKKAMKVAINGLKKEPDYILIDAVDLDLNNSHSLIKGDRLSQTISAASILAKVKRDEIMYKLDQEYPLYDYKNNKGYPTKKHLELIKIYGITKHYRKSYNPVKEVIINEQKNI